MYISKEKRKEKKNNAIKVAVGNRQGGCTVGAMYGGIAEDGSIFNFFTV
jgi:hypothetical protein